MAREQLVRMSEEGVAPMEARPSFTIAEGLADIRRRQDSRTVKYRNAKFLSVTVPVDRDRCDRLLPAGVRMAEDSTALLFVADYPWTNFNSVYREAAIFLNVKHGPFRAAHCPWIVVDDDTAMIGGRETLGFPKKIAEIDWEEAGDSVHATVRRRGVELLRLHGTKGGPRSSLPPIFNQPFRNVLGTLGLSVPRLVTFKTTDEPRELRAAEVELAVGGSFTDPLDTIVSGPPLEGHFRRVDMRVGRLPLPVGLVSPTYLLRTHPMRAS
ncbi:acetoacetate decarboxylase family protein [Amycolatopsis mongoliensis]|uniref:Acetoacetate decarboxylase family protein n=1 Tax=Amycolatopsis mongoliensis TaxID=715475 RepID=A0A9Y2JGQ1_9PSEU|nr:acetoacetate decarboxylase family protein [Amycolatopsis sp. 4-36]WIX98174.1 acetoacetate decarboxylase family protein [Amycolatopsis sp. 4-36]